MDHVMSCQGEPMISGDLLSLFLPHQHWASRPANSDLTAIEQQDPETVSDLRLGGFMIGVFCRGVERYLGEGF